MYVCVCVWLRESAVCGQLCPSLQAESRGRRWSLLSASLWLSRSFRCGLEVQVWGALLRLLPYWPLRVNPPLSAGDTACLCGGRTHHGCFESLFWLPACPPPPPLPPAAATFLSGSNSPQFLKYASLSNLYLLILPEQLRAEEKKWHLPYSQIWNSVNVYCFWTESFFVKRCRLVWSDG